MAVGKPNSVDVDFGAETQRKPLTLRFKGVKVNPGEEVYARGNFEATDEVPDGGWGVMHKCEQAGNIFIVTIPDLEVGRTYEYQLYFRDPNTGVERWLEGENKTITIPKEGVEPSSGPQPKPGSSPQPKVESVRKGAQGEVEKILTDFGDSKTVETLLGTIRALQHRGIAPTAVLEACARTFRENKAKKFPYDIAILFSEGDPPSSFEELEQRLQLGLANYRKTVFLELLKDEDARKLFKLTPSMPYDEKNPLGTEKHNKILEQHCRARCRVGLGTMFESMLGEAPDDSQTSPEIMGKLEKLKQNILDNLPPEERKKVLSGELTEDIVDLVVNGGATALLFCGLPGTGFAIAGIKGAIEGMAGMRLSELLRLREERGWERFLDKLKKNNIFTETYKAKSGHRWDVFKKRIYGIIGRALPFINVGFSVKDVFTSDETADKNYPKAFELIQKACDRAAKES